MDRLGVGAARLVATSAVRDAVNGAEFLEAAAGVLGVPAELLSGEEEGRLAFAGATADLPPVRGDDVVVDIGGGSTELVVGRGGRVEAVSLDMGCVRLTERHLRHDPPSRGRAGRGHRLGHRGRAGPGARWSPRLGHLASRGAASSAWPGRCRPWPSLDQGLASYDRERIHHAVLDPRGAERWFGPWPAETARALGPNGPGMDPGRQDVIVAGVLILEEVMATLGLKTCLVSERDILDGLVESVQAATAPGDPP